MVLGLKGPGRVGRRRITSRNQSPPRPGRLACISNLQPTVSTLAIVLIVLATIVLLAFIGGLLGARRRDERAGADLRPAPAGGRPTRSSRPARATAAGTASVMEQVARAALAENRPGVELPRPRARAGRRPPRGRGGSSALRGRGRRRSRPGGAGAQRSRLDSRASRLSPTAAAYAGDRRPGAGGRGACARGLVPGFVPENALEQRLASEPVLLEGLAWGKPRYGHPEGTVGAHVADLLRTIDAWDETGPRRAELRFLALVHDALKNEVREWRPRTGENHHAMRARRFAEELHRATSGCWPPSSCTTGPTRSGSACGAAAIPRRRRWTSWSSGSPTSSLFVRFVELDGSTEGKEPGARRMVQGRAAEARHVALGAPRRGQSSRVRAMGGRRGSAHCSGMGNPSSASPYSPRVESSTSRSTRSRTAAPNRCLSRGNMCSSS